jgi:predicted metal-dependent phosphotriesterase family hydrolase
MTIVNSVLGPLDTADFGVTLAHEHVFSSSRAIPQVYPELLGNGYKDLIIRGLNERKAGLHPNTKPHLWVPTFVSMVART